MTVRILGDEGTAAHAAAKAVVESLGHKVDDGTYFVIDIAIAPLLTRIIPAMTRTLHRALGDIARGRIRRVPQIDKYATYDKFIK